MLISVQSTASVEKVKNVYVEAGLPVLNKAIGLEWVRVRGVGEGGCPVLLDGGGWSSALLL